MMPAPQGAAALSSRRDDLGGFVLQTEPMGQAIVEAYRGHGYPMREIADFLYFHYTTVSRRIRRYEQDKRCWIAGPDPHPISACLSLLLALAGTVPRYG